MANVGDGGRVERAVDGGGPTDWSLNSLYPSTAGLRWPSESMVEPRLERGWRGGWGSRKGVENGGVAARLTVPKGEKRGEEREWLRGCDGGGCSECRVNNFHLRGCNHPIGRDGLRTKRWEKERKWKSEKKNKRRRSNGGIRGESVTGWWFRWKRET